MCTVPAAISRPKKLGKGIIAQENPTLKFLHALIAYIIPELTQTALPDLCKFE